MVALPAVTPVTTPELISTVAIPGALLVQVPPLLPLEVALVEPPIHTDAAALMVPAFNTGFTVIGADASAMPHELKMV